MTALPRSSHRARAGLIALGALLMLGACSSVDPYAWSRGSESRREPDPPTAPGGSAGTASGTAASGGRGTAGPGQSAARTPPPVAPMTSAGTLPAAVQPPPPVTERLRAVAIGDIIYECRRHLIEPARFVWSFVVPNATLYDAAKRPVGRYYAGPTWEGNDHSKVTGRQVGTARVPGSDLPLQLIKADVSTGTGIMKGVTYIQRLNVTGGIPEGPCGPAEAGKRQQVKFQADYVFY